eukprot:scaffold141420_cov18-Tisochrysis_lutea.AAC.2
MPTPVKAGAFHANTSQGRSLPCQHQPRQEPFMPTPVKAGAFHANTPGHIPSNTGKGVYRKDQDTGKNYVMRKLGTYF